MITYENFAFASPPRTGTTWFVKAAHLAGFGERQKTHAHLPPPDNWGGFVLSIVRNPVDWLTSYFLALEGGCVNVPCIDILAQCYQPNDLVGSFDRYLQLPKNTISNAFNSYQATMVIKLEDFPWAPLEFFYSLGFKEKDSQIRNMPPQNQHYGVAYSIAMDVRRRIIRHEEEMCERYEYIL